MEDCVYCKIVRKELPSQIEMETDDLIVFKDIHPSASIHLLIVPKKHILDLSSVDDKLWLEIKEVTLKLAEKLKTSGYRILNNAKAAQVVKHMHVHFLGEIGADREL